MVADRLLANPVIEESTVDRQPGRSALMAARVGVVVFPGTNCEHDAVLAVERLGGAGRAGLARGHARWPATTP